MFERYAIRISELETLLGCNMVSNIIHSSIDGVESRAGIGAGGDVQYMNRITDILNSLDETVASLRYSYVYIVL